MDLCQLAPRTWTTPLQQHSGPRQNSVFLIWITANRRSWTAFLHPSPCVAIDTGKHLGDGVTERVVWHVVGYRRLSALSAESWMFPSPRTGQPYEHGSLQQKMIRPVGEKFG